MKRNVRWLSYLQYSKTSAGRIEILPADVFKPLVTVGGYPPTARAVIRMSHSAYHTLTLSIQIDKVTPNREFSMYDERSPQQQLAQKTSCDVPRCFSALRRQKRNASSFPGGGAQ